jgi:hypothetical protein
MPPEDIEVGNPNLDTVGWIRHLIEESKRLGEHVREEGRDTQKRFDEIKSEMSNLRLEIERQVGRVSTAQKLTDREMKLKISGISAVVSAIVTALITLLKMGILK